MQVLGYLRVSTAEQADSRAGLEAQRAAIQLEAARRGWDSIRFVEDAGYSARDLRRPGIREALAELRAGTAGTLVVAKLDRLSRSMIDFTAVMGMARDGGWALVALDCAVDTTTPAGEAMANVLATFAQFERRLIGQRTKEALAEKRRQGVRLGRPPLVDAGTAGRVMDERSRGRTFRQIADGLNADHVLTAHGAPAWRASTVHALYRRLAAA